MPDPDVEVIWKGRGGGGGGVGGGSGLKKVFFRLFGPPFGLEIRGPPPLDPLLNLITSPHSRIQTEAPLVGWSHWKKKSINFYKITKIVRAL